MKFLFLSIFVCTCFLCNAQMMQNTVNNPMRSANEFISKVENTNINSTQSAYYVVDIRISKKDYNTQTIDSILNTRFNYLAPAIKNGCAVLSFTIRAKNAFPRKRVRRFYNVNTLIKEYQNNLSHN